MTLTREDIQQAERIDLEREVERLQRRREALVHALTVIRDLPESRCDEAPFTARRALVQDITDE